MESIKRQRLEEQIRRLSESHRTETQPWVLRQQFQRFKTHLRELALEDSLLQSAMELAH